MENSKYERNTAYLPSYTFGGDEAYDSVPTVLGEGVKKVCIIGGKTALSKVTPVLLPILEKAGIIVTDTIVYGTECFFDNGKRIAELAAVKEADVLFAVGGGKAIDTVKLVSYDLGDKAYYTFPTVASTCAATSKVAAVYTEEHAFVSAFDEMRTPAKHCFINARILVEAPVPFVWAGMGDTIAKHYEPAFSARGRELTFEVQLGVAMSVMCADPILEHCKGAMEAATAKTRNHAFDQVCMAVIFTTGLVSNFLVQAYNSNLAHAFAYGLVMHEHLEKNHLHGEMVSYGVLLLLTVDKQLEARAKWLDAYKAIKLPTKLADLELTKDDLDIVLDKALAVPDTETSPYVITREMIIDAINELEAL